MNRFPRWPALSVCGGIDDRGRETREFDKNGGIYPSVQEAFRQLFVSFYEKHQCPVCKGRVTYWIDYQFDEEEDDEDQDDDIEEISSPAVNEEKYYAGDDVMRFVCSHERWHVKIRYDDVNDENTDWFDEALFHCGSCGHNWND